ncbi:hypothetical protein GUITHDRAFT_153571, partial [Guillardia theta CCMP2712]
MAGEGGKKFSASWLMEQLMRTKDELKEAKMNIRLLEETLSSQAGKTNELRMKLEHLMSEKASLVEQLKAASSSSLNASHPGDGAVESSRASRQSTGT